MEVETTHTGIEVDVVIGMDELTALLSDGEVLVHPDHGPSLGLIYDQHERAEMLSVEYEDADDAEPLLMAQRDVAEMVSGDSRDWDHHHPPDVDVTVSFDPERAEGPAVGATDLIAERDAL